MAANDFGLVEANAPTHHSRSEVVGTHADTKPIVAQIVLVADSPELIPNLSGAGLVLDIVSSGFSSLVPPTAGARTCWIRAWETTQQVNKRLFYHRKNVTPINDGSNAEGFLLHSEGRTVRIATFAEFKLIAEVGSIWKLYCEWSNLS